MRTPVLSRRVIISGQDQLFSTVAFIDINISDGRNDKLIYNNFGGRLISFYHGDASWSKADFRNVFTGVVSEFEIISDSTLRINFVDGNGYLDKALTDVTITGGDNDGRLSPILYGACKNVTPILIDEATQRYKVNQGAVQDACSQLYIGGTAQTNVITKDNVNGEFTVGGTVDGEVTCDCAGMAPTAGGTAWMKPGAIIQDILTRFGDIDISRIDTASVTAYDADAPDIGVYITDEVFLSEAITDIAESHFGWFNFNRAGQFSIHKFVDIDSGATPVATFNDTNIIGRLKLKHSDVVPAYRIDIGYDQNWTVKSDANSADNGAREAFLKEEYRYINYESPDAANIKLKYANAIAQNSVDTYIINQADAQAEAQARMTIYGQQRYFVEPKATAQGLTVELGDIVSITSNRFDLDNQLYMVISIDDDLLNSTSEIGGWF